MSKLLLSSKAWEYRMAVYNFFEDISEIAFIDGLKFEKSTKNRIYFYIDSVAHLTRGIDYLMVYVFVRKKDLSVEICDGKTGQIITPKMLQRFEKDAEKAFPDVYDDDEYDEF